MKDGEGMEGGEGCDGGGGGTAHTTPASGIIGYAPITPPGVSTLGLCRVKPCLCSSLIHYALWLWRLHFRTKRKCKGSYKIEVK